MMLFDDEVSDEDDLFSESESVSDNAPVPSSAHGEIREPRRQAELIAHMGIEKILLEMNESGRMPQSLIFNGPRGVGKSTMAFRLARFLFRHGVEKNEGGLFSGVDFTSSPPSSLFVSENDTVFLQVASGGYPDLKVIERPVDEKGKVKSHDLEDVRSVATFFRKTASVEGGWRIAIIDDADAMNWECQNALLKILEEPPQRSLLILISHRIGALLPTILSRAIVINFSSLSDGEIKAVLEKYAPSPIDGDIAPCIIGMASGSIGQALYYASPDRSEIMGLTLASLARWPKLDWVKIHDFANQLGERGVEESGALVFRDTLLWIVTRLAKCKALNSDLSAELCSDGMKRLLKEVSLPRLIQLCDDLKTHFDQVQTSHLDRRYMVLQAFQLASLQE